MRWDPLFNDKRAQAYEDYMRANHGKLPPDGTSLIPYFKRALDYATAEKLRRIDRQSMR